MNGLSSTEAAVRLNQHGPNRLQPATQRAEMLQFLVRFKNPLVLVLLAASGISALTGDGIGAFIIGLIGLIGLIVLMSVTLDFVQAHRAGRAAQRLSEDAGGADLHAAAGSGGAVPGQCALV